MLSSYSSHMRLALFVALLAAAPAHARLADTCFNFLEAQDYPRAEAEARSLLKINALAREDERLIQLCLGRTLDSTGRLRDALPVLERVETLSRSNIELWAAYTWLQNTLIGLGNLDRAEIYAQRGLKVAKLLGDKSREATTLNNLASIVEKRGDVVQALTLYRDSVALEPNETKKTPTLNNIALIHASRGEYVEAVTLLREAIEIERRQGNSHQAAQWRLNLGNTMRQQGDLSGAERELTAGLRAIQMVGDRNWEATASVYLAKLAVAMEARQAAKGWYHKAEAIYRSLGMTEQADIMKEYVSFLSMGDPSERR